MNKAFVIFLSFAYSITAPAVVAAQTGGALSDHISVGTWYGRALPDDPANAPVPEVIMLVSFFADGTLIANDAIEVIIRHGTAHGHWQETGERASQSTFVWLNLTEDTPADFAGSFKVVLDAFVHADDPDKMGGILEAWVFPPDADPLDPENTGAVPLGTFTIDELVRVQCQEPAGILQDRSNDLSVGSWYGRALPDDPSTAPVPEVIMMPTFYADGNLIANDAIEMLIRHGTAHGHWIQTGENQVVATFIWLNISDETPNGFTGIFKVVLTGVIDAADPNKMGGTLDAWVFPPGTNPLDPKNTGAVPLGRFTIEELVRIRPATDLTVQERPADPSVGTWYGRALPDDPANAIVPELVMMPTFNTDGNLIANHATEASLLHGTGHGAWVSSGEGTNEGTFVWLNLSIDEPNGFVGTYKININGRINEDDPNTMGGTLEALGPFRRALIRSIPKIQGLCL